MASSFSTDLKLELMVTGENAGTWGTKTNTNLNLLQQAIAGFQSISIAGGAQTTALTMDNAAISNARNAVVKLTGTITGNQVVTVPDGIEKTYIVQNGTVGVFTVEFKTASGTGVTFATTNKGFKIVYSDGTNIVDVELSSVNPIIEKILDTNGNEEIIFTATASAVNELTIANAATGNAPSIATSGSDTNIDLKLTPKGTGGVIIPQINDTNGNEEIKFTATASAVNELTIANSATGASPTISATGSDTNIGINLTPKGTGGIVLGAGAVGTPALTTSGDLNTGIFFPTADTIAFTEGGAEAMRIDSSGNVGIGKSSPATKLDVNGEIFRNCVFGPPMSAAQTGTTEITEAIQYVWSAASARGDWSKSAIIGVIQYTIFKTGSNNSYLVWEMLLNNSLSFTWTIQYSNYQDATSRSISAEYSLNGGSSYTSAGTATFGSGSATLTGTKTFNSATTGRHIIFRTNWTAGAQNLNGLGIEIVNFTTNGGELTFIKSLG